MRTFVVGDIHGGYKALIQVLDKVPFTPADLFIFVGDYVDGWSESAQVISFLLEFSKKQNCLFLKGNHDDLFYQHLQGNTKELWLQHGGRETLESYKQLSNNEKNAHFAFFKTLHTFHIDKDNNLFCHAGFTNVSGPEYEYHQDYIYWDRTLWETACGLDNRLTKNNLLYPKRLALFNEIFIGHTSVTKIDKTTPQHFGNVWNVDTGAAFKGKLSVLDIYSKEYWQSDPVYTLYPDETGRN